MIQSLEYFFILFFLKKTELYFIILEKSDEPKVSSLDEGSPSLDTLTPEQSSLTSLLRMGSMSVFFSKNDNIVQTLERKKIEEDLRSKERRETV